MSQPTSDATLFRFTNPTDTVLNIADTEKIEFNFGAAPDDTGRLIANKFKMSRDINIHPNPRRALDQVQDSLLGLLDVTLNGYFVSHSVTLGPKNLFNFQVGAATNSNFPFGRFGIILNNFAGGFLSLIPTTTTGYILYDVEVDDVEDPRDEVIFKAQLYRNGSIAEV